MIPCKENKCILLPICQHKRLIKCNDLYEWLKTNCHNFDLTRDLRKKFKEPVLNIKPTERVEDYDYQKITHDAFLCFTDKRVVIPINSRGD